MSHPGMLVNPKSVFGTFNSHAGGMAVELPYGFEIVFWETLFLDQLHDFSLLSLNSY